MNLPTDFPENPNFITVLEENSLLNKYNSKNYQISGKTFFNLLYKNFIHTPAPRKIQKLRFQIFKQNLSKQISDFSNDFQIKSSPSFLNQIKHENRLFNTTQPKI